MEIELVVVPLTVVVDDKGPEDCACVVEEEAPEKEEPAKLED